MEYVLTMRQAKEAVHKIWTGPKALSLVPLLIGDQGTAKSAVLIDVAVMCKLIPRQLFIAQSLPEEIIGICHKDLEKNLMTMIQPSWTENCAKCAIIIDEPNRGGVEVRNALMQVPLYRRLHLFDFPETTRFGAAMNPDSSITDGATYQVEGMDRALETRFVPMLVRPDYKEWVEDFAKPHGVHPVVIEFLHSFPEHFHYVDKDGSPSPSPRSWERVSDLIHTGFTTLPFFFRHLGVKAGVVFCRFVADRFERLTIRELIEDYATMQPKIKALTPSMAGDILAQVGAYINEKGVNDETSSLLEKILPDLKPDFRLALGAKINGLLINKFIKQPKLLDLLHEVVRASKGMGGGVPK